MKFMSLAVVAALGLAAFGARAAEEYPTPITRPIYSSAPMQDVGGGGPWSKSTVVTGNGGYTAANGAEAMPTGPVNTPAVPVYVQHGAVPGTHG